MYRHSAEQYIYKASLGKAEVYRLRRRNTNLLQPVFDFVWPYLKDQEFLSENAKSKNFLNFGNSRNRDTGLQTLV